MKHSQIEYNTFLPWEHQSLTHFEYHNINQMFESHLLRDCIAAYLNKL